MKKLRQIGLVLLIALISILLWEGMKALTPEGITARSIAHCRAVYAKNRAALTQALPSLIAGTDADGFQQTIGSGLDAYVHGDSPANCIIEIPLQSIGDFYRHSYLSGLIRAEDWGRVLEKNPRLILIPLEDGWYAYVNVQPQ